VPHELKRIFGIHNGTPETNVSWNDVLDALEECSGKLELPAVSFLNLRDTLIALKKKRQEQQSTESGGGSSNEKQRTPRDKKRRKKNDSTDSDGDSSNDGGDPVSSFHVAVAFHHVEYIGGIWTQDQLDVYNDMDSDDRKMLDRQLNRMIRTNKRIDTQHFSYGLSREAALAATLRKMEELNPYSQQGVSHIVLFTHHRFQSLLVLIN